MEQFARLVVASGIALVAGLWVTTVSGTWSVLRVVGGVLVALGLFGLAGGIWSKIDHWRLELWNRGG